MEQAGQRAVLFLAAAALVLSSCDRGRSRPASRPAKPTTQPRATEVRASADAAEEHWTQARELIESVAGKEPTAALVELLKSDDWVVRELAAEGLGWPGRRPAVPPLVAALEDRSFLVRAAAAAALGRCGDRRAIRPLMKVLLDREPWVRLAAARALNALDDGTVQLPLLKQLGDESHARQRRAEAYREPGARPWHAALVSAMEQAGLRPDKARLLEHLKSPDPTVRAAAIEWLAQAPAEDLLKPISTAMKDESVRVRVAAAEALGRFNRPAARQALTAAVGDSEPAVRAAAVHMLAGMPGEHVVSPLIERLAEDRDARVRAAAAEGLGHIDDPRATTALLAALSDPEPAVRHTAMLGLDMTAVEAIQRPGGKPQSVAGLLAILDDDPAGGGLTSWAAERLGELGDRRAVEPLIAVLRRCNQGGGDAQTCVAAARALAKLGDRRAVEALGQALWDEDAGVRLAATRALVAIGPPAAETLLELLSASDQALRRAAVKATGRQDVEALVAAWKTDPALRAEALKVLGAGPDVVASLSEMLGSGEGRTRRRAARMLGRMGGEAAAKALVACLADEDDLLGIAARDALVGIGPEAAPLLVAAMKHQQAKVRRAAADALGRIGGAGAVAALTAGLGDADWVVRYRAARGLGRLEDRSALAALRAALNDKNDVVRRAAAEAVQKLQP